MKKIYLTLLFIISIIGLTSCNEKEMVKIIVPNGSPALAQAMLQHDYKEIGNKKISVENVGASVLVSAFASEEYDIIYAPSDMGIRMYNNNQKYVYVANVTWGNVYIASARTGDFNFDTLDNKDLYLFGEGQVQSMIVNKVLMAKGVNYKSITYLDDASSTMEKLIIENDSIVLMAEPSLTAAKTSIAKNGKTVQTIDILEEYKNMSGSIGYPQAGVFIKKKFFEKNLPFIEKYLNLLEESCTFANEESLTTSEYAEELEYGLPKPAILSNAIANCNINFKTAKNSKSAIIACYQNDLSYIGGKLPDEGFYAY